MSLTGKPKMDARIVHLGQFLKLLGCGTNDTKLSVKMDELRSDSFSAAYFELKVASLYARSGFDVEFLKPPKNSKSPDLRISRDGTATFLECKKRKPQSDTSLEARIGGVTDSLRDARQQIAAVSKYGIVYVEVEDNVSFADQRLYSQAIAATLPDLPEVCGAVVSWEEIEVSGDVFGLITRATGYNNPVSVGPCQKHIWCNPAALAPAPLSAIVDLPEPMRAP